MVMQIRFVKMLKKFFEPSHGNCDLWSFVNLNYGTIKDEDSARSRSISKANAFWLQQIR